MSIARKLLSAGGSEVSDIDVPEAVSFDGVEDYLTRSSDLTGNVDSKTFTFSCWIYYYGVSSCMILGMDWGTPIYFSAYNITVSAYNAADDAILNIADIPIPKNTYTHLLVSCDLAAGTRQYCINGVLGNIIGSSSDDYIDFTKSIYTIGVYGSAHLTIQKFKGRLAHLYLDYTYRDLSIEANRRLFITEDLKPADGLASLSPILYLPMKDADTAGDNLGTGGDFTVNGTLDTAGRGPNQDNCTASYFDNNNDYLQFATSSGALTTIRFSAVFNNEGFPGNSYLYYCGYSLYIKVNTTGTMQLVGYDADDNLCFNLTSPAETIIIGKQYHVAINVDTVSTTNKKMYINGVDITSTCTFTNNGNPISFHNLNAQNIGQRQGAPAGTTYQGSIGEVWMDTSDEGLDTASPFWDYDTNKPVSVRKILSDDESLSPLLAMPLNLVDVGLNLGSVGDFTNSNIDKSVRGASEYISRGISVSTSEVTTNSLSGLMDIQDSPTFSIVLSAFNLTANDNSAYKTLFHLCETAGGTNKGIKVTLGNYNSTYDDIFVTAYDGTGTVYTGATNILRDSWHILLASFDIVNKEYTVFLDGAIRDTSSGDTTTASTFPFSDTPLASIGRVMNNSSGGYSYFGSIGGAYFTTEYIDFSDEENRNLFVDQLGYPKDLTPFIKAGTIPNPLIYMKFDDVDDLGANSGTGGDFTVNGTVTAGSDFSS